MAQNFRNHRRTVPLFHIVVTLCLMTNLVWAAHRALKAPSGDTVVSLILAVGLVLLGFFVRAFPVRVQDRLIRLEMQLRMRDLLPAELQARIHEFTPRQLIALRFASDRELPDLAAAVLRDHVQNATAIKKMITEWRADHLRV
jgi:hypothetical protein